MIPPTTIARVFGEVSFSKDTTRITPPALSLSTEYIRLFIREAVSRSNAQRLSKEAPTVVSGIDDVGQEDLASYADEPFGNDSDEFEEEDRGSGVPTQVPPSNDTNDTNDALTTLHLAAVSGLLVMDF